MIMLYGWRISLKNDIDMKLKSDVFGSGVMMKREPQLKIN